ncbi:hypothetical protein R76706_03599 [Ralstonia mannitolilytica]|nr:hypothetical protein R76706_03599 [Ralstonia mannitolilytica]
MRRTVALGAAQCVDDAADGAVVVVALVQRLHAGGVDLGVARLDLAVDLALQVLRVERLCQLRRGALHVFEQCRDVAQLTRRAHLGDVVVRDAGVQHRVDEALVQRRVLVARQRVAFGHQCVVRILAAGVGDVLQRASLDVLRACVVHDARIERGGVGHAAQVLRKRLRCLEVAAGAARGTRGLCGIDDLGGLQVVQHAGRRRYALRAACGAIALRDQALGKQAPVGLQRIGTPLAVGLPRSGVQFVGKRGVVGLLVARQRGRVGIGGLVLLPGLQGGLGRPDGVVEVGGRLELDVQRLHDVVDGRLGENAEPDVLLGGILDRVGVGRDLAVCHGFLGRDSQGGFAQHRLVLLAAAELGARRVDGFGLGHAAVEPGLDGGPRVLQRHGLRGRRLVGGQRLVRQRMRGAIQRGVVEHVREADLAGGLLKRVHLRLRCRMRGAVVRGLQQDGGPRKGLPVDAGLRLLDFLDGGPQRRRVVASLALERIAQRRLRIGHIARTGRRRRLDGLGRRRDAATAVDGSEHYGSPGQTTSTRP